MSQPPAPDLKELMRMAQQMQDSMKKAQQDLSSQRFTGRAGGDVIEVIIDGEHWVKSVKILDPKIVENITVLCDLFVAAHNAALREALKTSEKTIMDLTKKLGLPGAPEGEDER